TGRHYGRPGRPRLSALAPVLPRTADRGRDGDGDRAHQQLHRRLSGPLPRRARFYPAAGGVLARGTRSLPRPHGVRRDRRESRRARGARGGAPAPRARRTLRRLRPVSTFTSSTTSTASPTSVSGREGAAMCGIFGAVSLAGRPLRHPGCLGAMAAALAHRGRAGEKPLFWTQVEGEIRFASEIQALLVFPDQPRRLNPTAAALYAALGYVPAPHTMFAGIAKLEPGHVLVAHEGGVTERRYWDAAAVAAGPSRLDAPATLRATLLRAVERELMSDVPVGVFTSGGLDSSLLAAAAARVMPGEQIHTYSVRFVEPGYDESPYAEAVTHHIRTQHHVVAADEPALERAFTTITRGLAEPVGDPAILPTYLLAEAAREDVKVVLSGEGADELFGGYPTYLGHKAAALFQRTPGRAVLRWLVNRLPTSGR